MLEIQADIPLTSLNTFGLPAVARQYVHVRSAPQVQALVRRGALADGHVVLGGGSNTILVGDVAPVLLHVGLRGRRLIAEDADGWCVEAAAGEGWHDFVRWTLAQGWPGLENLSLIPGTVGAAPIQNIGAYGIEMAARFESLDAVDLGTGAIRRFDAAECAFGYRDSCFKGAEQGRWMIVAVRFRLPRAWSPVLDYADVADELHALGHREATPTAVSDAIIRVRQRKLPDPARIGNAGSFFKNPVVDGARLAALQAAHPNAPAYPLAGGGAKLAAGWLIDQCGWKGRAIGPVGVYERQALVLVNRGGATGADVRHAAEMIRRSVRERFGIELEPEPVFVGG